MFSARKPDLIVYNEYHLSNVGFKHRADVIVVSFLPGRTDPQLKISADKNAWIQSKLFMLPQH